MKKKVAIRPIRRTSPADGRPLVCAQKTAHGYPDARTLADAIREVAFRAIQIAAIPTAGLLAGCSAGSGDVADGLSPIRLPWQGLIGTVVEGLRAPEETVPLAGVLVPVQPYVAPPPPPPDPYPIPTAGVPRNVNPTPPPPTPPTRPPAVGGIRMPVQPDPEPPEVVGLMGSVQPAPGPHRALHASVPIPQTLSDEALAAALSSIAS